MNYIKLELGGKERGLKFNQFSLEVYTGKVDMQLPVSSTIYATFYAGLMGNCKVKSEEPDFNFEDVCDWVDKLYEEGKKEEIEKVCDVWADTHAYKEWLKEFNERLATILEPDAKPKKKVK